MADPYDVIVIGTGAGGGTLAHTLAPSGKRILLLERGNFLPREMDNWDPKPVFVDGKYISRDTWFDRDGKSFQPQVHYFVGGATKLYGAALYRLRPGDFGEIKHASGISPAWPLSYDDFEPWYSQAEQRPDRDDVGVGLGVHQARVAVAGGAADADAAGPVGLVQHDPARRMERAVAALGQVIGDLLQPGLVGDRGPGIRLAVRALGRIFPGVAVHVIQPLGRRVPRLEVVVGPVSYTHLTLPTKA